MLCMIENDIQKRVADFARRLQFVQMKAPIENLAEEVEDAPQPPSDASLKREDAGGQCLIAHGFTHKVNVIRLDRKLIYIQALRLRFLDGARELS
jgi:hypothetical protein